LRKIPCVIAIASESSKAMAIMGALRTGAISPAYPTDKTAIFFRYSSSAVCHNRHIAPLPYSNNHIVA
ncbi:hypothetical protein, partial [Providencia huashanensis]|uniref:hypothetical protein n=1 Tax=Providencia huashanensis TaxID=3037798 RepID=UPI002B000A8F